MLNIKPTVKFDLNFNLFCSETVKPDTFSKINSLKSSLATSDSKRVILKHVRFLKTRASLVKTNVFIV